MHWLKHSWVIFIFSEEFLNLAFRRQYENEESEDVLLGSEQSLFTGFQLGTIMRGKDFPFVKVQEK